MYGGGFQGDPLNWVPPDGSNLIVSLFFTRVILSAHPERNLVGVELRDDLQLPWVGGEHEQVHQWGVEGRLHQCGQGKALHCVCGAQGCVLGRGAKQSIFECTIVSEGFKGGTRGATIMPRDVSLSNSKCWNGGHKWVNILGVLQWEGNQSIYLHREK